VRAPSRREQGSLEQLWEASRCTYEQNRRRENCVAWIQHHDRLSRGYRDHSERHARERDRYQALFMCNHTTKGGNPDEPAPAA
jgi:hypothetical protein